MASLNLEGLHSAKNKKPRQNCNCVFVSFETILGIDDGMRKRTLMEAQALFCLFLSSRDKAIVFFFSLLASLFWNEASL